MLVATQAETVSLSLAGKRFSQNETGKVVLDEEVVTCALVECPAASALLAGLAIAGLPRIDLLAVYQGWIHCLEAFQAAQWTGHFVAAPTPEAARARRQALADHTRLMREIAVLRVQAKRASQMSRRVDINLDVQRREAEIARLLRDM